LNLWPSAPQADALSS